jgi:hypothetical protein
MSGCYQCGSLDGNEARLCPRCAAERLQSIPKFRPTGREQRKITRAPLYLVVALGAGLLIALGMFDKYRSLTRAHTNLPPSRDLYEDCKTATGRITQYSMSIKGRAIVDGMAVGLCDQMQKVCAENPKGEECRRIQGIVTKISRL